MRKLIVIATDDAVRNMLSAGAFAQIEDEDTYYVAGDEVRDLADLENRRNFLGQVPQPADRRAAYHRVRSIQLAAYRFRSRTQKLKLREQPFNKRLRLKVAALPGPRQLAIRRHLRRSGLHPQLRCAIEKVRPDLVIVPSDGLDTLAMDAVRASNALGVTNLAVIFNWDNLSSKAAFLVPPDYLAVCGPQSAEHAQTIHGIPPERVTPIGGPYVDRYFRHRPGSTKSPFGFRYALFAGCFLPFHERDAVERLDRLIGEHELDLRLVYRPHPKRRPRKVSDLVEEDTLQHVVIDPQVRDQYLRSFHTEPTGENQPQPYPKLPSLDYYPALLEHAAFTVCPLSTMLIESAIFEKRVAVIAYHDGIHRNSPGAAINYLHFEGIDEVEGFDVCRSPEALEHAFVHIAQDSERPRRSLRDQMSFWMYHDERTYSERLADLVKSLAAEHGWS